MKKSFLICVALLLLSFSVTNCSNHDEMLPTSSVEESKTTNVARISIDDILAQNPDAGQIVLSGSDGNIKATVFTKKQLSQSETNSTASFVAGSPVTYSLGYYSSVTISRLAKSAVSGKMLRITVNAGREATNSCGGKPIITMPIVEKTAWNNGNPTVLQTVQVTQTGTYMMFYDGRGCASSASKELQKQGTINQYDVAAYQEIGWVIRTQYYSSTFTATVDVL